MQQIIFSPGKQCDTGEWNDSCCTPKNPCPDYQGDCDKNIDCLPGLRCGKNNCPKSFQMADDCCYDPKGGSGGMYIVCTKSNVQPKPLFWFWYDTETKTQIGRYFRPIP